MAIFLLSGGSSQRDGVCVGGSCRRWKTVSCLSVALVGVQNSEISLSWWLSETMENDYCCFAGESEGKEA
ncbi:hypothetical protein IGI04_024108 [Brassica rapa subsp. trilocularis]|uniref:Uncharacterized protein n=1 Tax=Brassica rapa subsp. trilocularis TaxID=1813537 RepID=A0ABQ7M749_BRACM|nr:hypothetical protein IGI04_028590 [Brassica rapa subsp. trilocularis]KAG5394145.1 hypothetical protein IGI04_024108 [Brassica rapa subsp. trilocularis]